MLSPRPTSSTRSAPDAEAVPPMEAGWATNPAKASPPGQSRARRRALLMIRPPAGPSGAGGSLQAQLHEDDLGRRRLRFHDDLAAAGAGEGVPVRPPGEVGDHEPPAAVLGVALLVEVGQPPLVGAVAVHDPVVGPTPG